MLDRIAKKSSINELVPGALYALQNTMALDGRVSAYPHNATGYSVTNCYLLKQPDAALLIDTGFGCDEPTIRGQIESLIPKTLPLSLLPLRLNEFMSIQNVEPFSAYFNVEQVYTGNPDAALWFDFGAGSDSGQDTLHRLKISTIGRDPIPIGGLGRAFLAYNAPIRLIATRWIYDEATRTLFTSDMFSHVWRQELDGPWIVQDGDEDTIDFDWLRSYLLHTRYWWLEGVDTTTLRRDIDKIFEKHDVETLAPGYGCVLRGRKTVAKHYKLMDDVLKSLDKSVAVSRYISRDEVR